DGDYHSLHSGKLLLHDFHATILSACREYYIGKSPASPITSGHSSSPVASSGSSVSSTGNVLREALITSMSTKIGQSARNASAIASEGLESRTILSPSLLCISITAKNVLSRKLVTTTRSTCTPSSTIRFRKRS